MSVELADDGLLKKIIEHIFKDIGLISPPLITLVSV